LEFKKKVQFKKERKKLRLFRIVSWSKTSDLALLERDVVKNVRFSIAGMCYGQKR
jgi:hypothetical protein